MSLERYINSGQILQSKSRLEGYVLSEEDRMSLSQDIAILNNIPNDFYILEKNVNLSVESHFYNISGDYLLSSYNTPFEFSDTYKDFSFNIPRIFDNFSLLSGQFKISMSFVMNLLGDSDNLPLTIKEISPDRTEIKLVVKRSYIDLNPNIRSELQALKQIAGRLKSNNRLNNLFLNFTQNDHAHIVNMNVDCSDELVVYVKLYAPLLDTVSEKETSFICFKVLEDYVDTFILKPQETSGTSRILSNPKFSSCSPLDVSNETNIKNWNSLLDTDAVTNNRIIREIFSGSTEVPLNIDYTDFKNFVYYGSATERLKNYDYKLKLIEFYTQEYNEVTQSISYSSSYVESISDNYIGRIEKIKDSFDGFETFLYNQTSSLFSYDVTGSISPNPKFIYNNRYVNYPTTDGRYTKWYNTILSSSLEYDRINYTSFYYNTPDHILRDPNNSQYVLFLHMVGQHFDNIYNFVSHLTKIHERDEHPQRGIPNPLLPYYIRSLGWKIQNTRNLSDLWLYKLGTDSTGSYKEPSGDIVSKSHQELSSQIWRRIVNNLPYLLKTKGSIRSVRALFSIYGIPFTLISVKEYGGPQIDSLKPPILSEDRFQYLLNFYGDQYIEIPRRLVSSSIDNISTIPQTTEFRFSTDFTGSASMSLWAVEDSTDVLQNLEIVHYTASLYGRNTYGYLKYTGTTGSAGNLTSYQVTSSLLPLYDDDIWTVRIHYNQPVYSGSLFDGITNIDVAKSSDFVDNRISLSASFSAQTDPFDSLYSLGAVKSILPQGHKVILGGTTGSNSERFIGSLQAYKEYLGRYDTGVFEEHVLNPLSYHTNAYTASYQELHRYYPMGLDNIRRDHTVYTVVSSSHPNQLDYTGSIALFKNFSGSQQVQYNSSVETHYEYYPSLGANNPKSNKIRLEDSILIRQLSPDRRAEVSRYDSEQRDSNRLAIVFSPTDQINRDITNQFGPYNFENFVGNPKDGPNSIYPNLENARYDYFKKFSRANDIGKYIEVFSLYDYSVFEQVKQLVPARSNLITGVLVEPHILERSKIERKFPSINVVSKDTVLKGVEAQISSSYIPIYNGVLDPPVDIAMEREKRKISIEAPLELLIDRTKNKGVMKNPTNVEIERSKLRLNKKVQVYSFDDEISGVKNNTTTLDLKTISFKSNYNSYEASVDATQLSFTKNFPIPIGDVTQETVTYTYKNASGQTVTKTVTNDILNRFIGEASSYNRTPEFDDVYSIDSLGVGSFYVYYAMSEVPFDVSQLGDENYIFYFTTIVPDIATVTSLNGVEFKEFIERYNYDVFSRKNVIFKKREGGLLKTFHVSGSRLTDGYSTIEYFFSSSGDFVLGETSPNMLESPVYLNNRTGYKLDYEKEKDYAINKEYNAFYSSSLKQTNYQHFENSRLGGMRFAGSKLVGGGINVDSPQTVTGGPVVRVDIVNENDIIVL